MNEYTFVSIDEQVILLLLLEQGESLYFGNGQPL
jgi:hypothetical protein